MLPGWLHGILGNRRPRPNRTARRAARRLGFESLEAREVPAAVTFQQGVGGYAGTTEVRLDGNDPTTAQDGAAAVDGVYTLDGTTADSLNSASQYDLIRFDGLFGPGAGQIPANALIRSATLTYHTASATEVGGAATAGPFTVSRVLAPFTTATTWNSFGGYPQTGTQLGAPGTAFRDATTDRGFAVPADADGAADVTAIVQGWAADPATALGFAVRPNGTSDGWAIRTVGYADPAFRPSLTITYDLPAVATDPVVTASFQQGVNGYGGTTSAWLQEGGTTTDGATLTAPTFLDGPAAGSPNDQMLIKFGDLFGSGPGQIPVGSTVQKAAFVLTTAGLADSTNSMSTGPYSAFQLNVPFTTTTKYTDADPFGGDGPTLGNPAEITLQSTRASFAYDSRVVYDVTGAVQNWLANPAQNFGLDIQANGTADGWQVHFSGSATVASRPQLLVYYTPPAAPAEPAANTVDIAAGTLTFTGGAGLANALGVSLAGGTYTLTDSSGAITLTQAALDAGWTGNGTATVSGSSATLSKLVVSTGAGADTVTLAGADDGVLVDAGGQAGDAIAVTGVVSSGNQDITLLNAGSVTATAAGLLDAGTGTATLSAAAVGTSTAAVRTRAGRLAITAAGGGAFVAEADGADLVADVSGAGALSVVNDAGDLQVPTNEVVRTAQGAITLASAGKLVVNGAVGVTALTGAGAVTLNANTDGDDADAGAYVQGARAALASGGNVTINVNTASGGAGSATLGTASIAGTFTVAAAGGNILWSPDLPIPAATSENNPLAASARTFVFSTTGNTGTIGTAAAPIQISGAGLTDAVSASTGDFRAGSGGLALTEWGPVDFTITRATATDTGDVRITAADAQTANNLIVSGPVSTGTGAVVLSTDDGLTLTSTAVVGGTSFGGTITLAANLDGAGEARLTMAAAATVRTTNATAAAVSLTVIGTDGTPSDAALGGIDLATVIVGDGGTITVNAAAAGGKRGNITQAAGGLLDAGASGRVVLNASAAVQQATILDADGVTVIPNPTAGQLAPAAGIGTASAPVLTRAGVVTVTSTNGPVFVAEADGASVTAAVTGLGDLAVASTAGVLTVAGATATDGGTLTLTASGTGGGVVVNAALGDANTGAITVDAGTGDVTFNTALTVPAGQTVTLVDGNGAELGVTTTVAGTIVAANGVVVGANETLTGTGTVGGPVQLLASGRLSPAAGSLSTLFGTGNLSLAANAITTLNLNGPTAGAGTNGDGTNGHDQLVTTGTVDVTGSVLRPVIGGTVTLNQSFTLIANDGTDAVVGQFAGGATVRAFNNPLIAFTVGYDGGDGNDVVLTVSSIDTASGLLDVAGGQVQYFSNTGINNAVTVTRSGGNYTITEGSGGAISLTAGAVAAGWTGGGTNAVTGTAAGVTDLVLGLNDGADTVNGVDAGAANLLLTGNGGVTVAGAVTTAGSFALDEFTTLAVTGSVSAGTGVAVTGLTPLTVTGTGSVATTAGSVAFARGSLTLGGVSLSAPGGVTLAGQSDGTVTLNTFAVTAPTLAVTGSGTVQLAGTVTATAAVTVSGGENITSTAAGLIAAPTVNLTASARVGASGAAIKTQATTISARGGDGGAFVTEADGASFSGRATGAGDVAFTSTTGTLTVGGAVSAATGNISLSSADDVAVQAVVGGSGFTGTLSIAANTDGAGAQGYSQTLPGDLVTANTTAAAIGITVNTASGGTGDAVLGRAVAGNRNSPGAGGGTLTVAANGGNILWAADVPAASGATTNNGLQARNYSFATSGAGGIGTAARPIATDVLGANGVYNGSLASLAAGTGGIYLTDYGERDLTIASALATGGDIRLVSFNAGGANLFFAGQVYTAAGNIALTADDDLRITGSTVGGDSPTGGGTPFAGTITLVGNVDGGNEQRIIMDGTSVVRTTNATADAVKMTVTATDNNAANASLGGVVLGTVTVGDGGTVTIDAAATAGSHGSINQIFGTVVNAGANGTVVLNARNLVNGLNPAVGAIIGNDLVGDGTNVSPLQVVAKRVVVTAVNTPIIIAEGSFLFPASDGLEVAAALTGLGSLAASTAGGTLAVAGATNTDGGTITLTATGSGAAIAVNAPLGDANTGNITLDAGTGAVAFGSTGDLLAAAGKTVAVTSGSAVALGGTTTLTAGSTLSAANGFAVGPTGTLTGTGAATVAGPLSVAGGTLTPGGTGVGTLATGSLALDQSGGVNTTFAADINGTAAGSFDRVNVAGGVNLSGVGLQVRVNNPVVVGDKFVLVANDGTDPIVGTPAGPATLIASNDPRYRFSFSTTGGDGNDLELTVTTVLSTLLDVTAGGRVQYSSGIGINNNVSVSQAGTTLSVTDTSTLIFLQPNAVAAGWTGNGTNTVSGPADTYMFNGTATPVTGLDLILDDGTDVVSSVTVGLTTTVTSKGTLSLAGPVDVTGSFTVSTSTAVTVNGAVNATGTIATSGIGTLVQGSGGRLTAPTLSLATTAATGAAVGTAAAPILTTATTITAAGGTGGVFLLEADGASFAATATGAGNVSLATTTGTLAVGGATRTGTGTITLTSADAVAVNATVGGAGFSGTIAVTANTDGAGAQGYSQNATGNLITTNVSTTAAAVTVNTAGGGTGDAVLGLGSVGSAAGGTITVTALNGGSILWTADLGALTATEGAGSANANTLKARDYVFTTSGAGGIGTFARPVQTDILATNNTFGAGSATLTAGTGGIYQSDWGAADVTVKSAVAAGGDIQIVAANAGGSNLYVAGDVTTGGGGNITLRADDDLLIGNATLAPNLTIGGAGFSGTVTLRANRDTGTGGQSLTMLAGTSIVTSNATANAVYIDITGDANANLTVSNVTVGDGGTIALNAAPIAGKFGLIRQQAGTTLNAGATGTVSLVTQLNGGATAGDAIGTATAPIRVTAGTVTASALAGNVYISDAVAGTFTATTASSGTLNLTTTAGVLTVGGATNTDLGMVNLTGAAGVAVNAAVGDANTGAINVVGPLSGTGSFALGTAGLSLNQGAASTFDGTISGGQGFFKSGSGSLTLTGTSGYTGATTVSGPGTLVVNGALTATSGVSVTTGGTLGGTGTVAAPVAVTGRLSPGAGGAGKLGTGNLSFAAGGVLDIDLLGVAVGTGYDQVAVAGVVNLTNAALNLSNGLAAGVGGLFVIVDNDGTDAVAGPFAGRPEGSTVTANGQDFVISYVGGDGNDVTLSRPAAPLAVTGVVVNAGDATGQRSRVTSLTVTFNTAVTLSGQAGLTPAFTLAGVDANGNPITLADADILVTNPSGDGKTWLLKFTDDGTNGGSLADGTWDLTVRANGVAAAGGGPALAADYSSAAAEVAIKRLYGDVNGDGQVNLDDLTEFTSTFGLADGDEGFVAGFDVNGDGQVNLDDLTEFTSRFGLSL